MTLPDTPILILHGDDEYAIAGYLHALASEFSSGAMGDVNVSRLDGAVNSTEEILSAVNSIPFFAEKRLVMIENPLPAVRKKSRGGEEGGEGEDSDTVSGAEKKQKFLAMLANAPESTLLVLAVADNPAWDSKTRAYAWEVLKDSHYLVKWMKENPGRAKLQAFSLPRPQDIPGWLTREAGQRGLKFNPAAVQELAQYVGNDTRLAAMELDKLDTYLGARRMVEAADVAAICTFTSSATIFQLVDAMGGKNTGRALELHHQLLETMDPQEIFPMIVRQFRLLLMAREAVDSRITGENDVAAQVGVAPFQAKNLLTQVRNFDRKALKRIYLQLMKIEEAAKSANADQAELVDALIVGAGG